MGIGRRELLAGALLVAAGVAASAGRGAAASRPTVTVYKSPG
jgi:hypothetical protein